MPSASKSTGTSLAKIEARVERLEKAVFGNRKTPRSKANSISQKGPTGGIYSLIEKGFFDSPNRRSLGDVRERLIQIGKDYSSQAVDIALRRLSKPTGPLVRQKVGKRHQYVARK